MRAEVLIGVRSRRRARLAPPGETLAAYAFVAPAAVTFGLFVAFPVAFSLWLSFHSWDGLTSISSAPSVGLANFRALLDDAIFRDAFVAMSA